MEYTAAAGDQLQTRTAEGLGLAMDITVEYKLIKEEIRPLFDLFLDQYEDFVDSAMLAELLNTASKFPAGDFISIARQNISLAMHEALDERLNPFHVDVVDVQLRAIDLVDAYEEKIELLEGQKLAQQEALAQRNVDLQNEANDRVTQVIELEAIRQQTLIDAQAEVDKAELKRDGDITEAQIADQTARLLADRQRQSVLIAVAGELAVAQAQREARLTERRNIQVATVLENERRIEEAVATAYTRVAAANATAIRTLELARATAEGIRLIRDAQKQQYVDLVNVANMTKEDVLRYAWLDTLKAYQNSKFFIDYKKVPLFLEGSSDNPRVMALLASLGLTQAGAS